MVWDAAKMILLTLVMLSFAGGNSLAEEVDVQGVKLARQKEVADKTLILNGAALRRAMGFVKVNVLGLYLENPTQDPEEVIASQQVKQLYSHYLSGMATAERLRNGFIEQMQRSNPPELFEAHRAEIEEYASWLDQDMQPGLTSIATYVPGEGLTLEYQGLEKGTIANPIFAEMYFRANVDEKADKNIREGLLGKK
jgi:hypothetical protein